MTLITVFKNSFIALLLVLPCLAGAQRNGNILDQVKGKVGNVGTIGKSGDSVIVHHRDDLKDSITISFRYLDSLKNNRVDSSLNDFNKFFSVPANYITLGNNGAAAYPVLFSPVLKTGMDPGFHAYDVYKYTLEGTKFFKTTKPYTQLTYLLGSGKEQLIKVLHTQNIKPNWNFGFDYKLITAPGFFKTQNTNHNSYRFFSNYQGKRKRYNAYFIFLGNTIAASENGGIQNDTFLSKPNFTTRFSIPTNLGGDAPGGLNVFSTKVSTGIKYKNSTFFYRQSYDLGKKDSIAINDSVKEYLFYPKFRFQHTLVYSTISNQFRDTLGRESPFASAQSDSAFFKKFYDTSLSISSGLLFLVKDSWKILSNDLSIKQFPETKNSAQFIEVGSRVENLQGTFGLVRKNFYNVVLHGEYRNKTKNKKWDAIAEGEFYPVGLNSGDYRVYASLTRYLNKKLGDVQVLFQNVNRTPSFVFNELSSFNFRNHLSLKKENITMISATSENPLFTLLVRNISITNYSYFTDYYHTAQVSGLLNITQAEGQKAFRLTKRLTLYSDVIIQQTAGNTPIRVPLFYTRQRVAFEGNFYKNLNLSTGLDISYHTPYKANGFSPVIGQFVPQDTVSINNLPDVNFFFHFRIKSFTGILRLENLNTISFANGVGFTNNNFAAPLYPTPGLIFRLGVQWGFVN